MKTVKNFNKVFLPCALLSCAVIVFGIVGIFARGINFGIDFVPGFIEEVEITSASEKAADTEAAADAPAVFTGTVNVDEVRSAFSNKSISVKALDSNGKTTYQIRAKSNGNEEADQKLKEEVSASLNAKFGAENVQVVREDYVGSSFSSSLAFKSVMLAFVTLLLIWGYATIRFHWDFALGAIVALVHDFLIMFAFISWSQVEFSTTTLAAVLTIFGYSINATVVILDRIRENIKYGQLKVFSDIINKSVSDTVARSIITTVTTLFASISLLVFTTGSIHDFAAVLTVGLISGCYSSMFISSGFIAFIRRNWKAEYQNHVHQPKPKRALAEISVE
ncbi:protein translocase subunit SecF [Treponema rectale]|uniref:Protein-export membrane protein SecF n=1 Tax=Treponema rectale TaxID=744512 RepID=A0A840SHI3_9SPIR|nr:protein translocase subunit SecF [Treponema rectale]MBB5218983.1 preprotein translocase SecF subunit [Treponema rectale]QOS41105.1 protein translocase subunit SecF [Treponema rectale]